MANDKLQVIITRVLIGPSGMIYLPGASVEAHQHEDVICLVDQLECFPIPEDAWEPDMKEVI